MVADFMAILNYASLFTSSSNEIL